MKSWTDLRLYCHLVARANDSRACHVLRHYMPIAETVLRSGTPNSPHFTLHDAEHGHRVAERMYELVGEEGAARLSEVEISMLLLAAYCHDIGMTPNREISTGVINYLITGDEKSLEKEKIADLHKWMDENAPNITIPVPTGATTLYDLSQIDYISSYYGRDRHNEWSADWIKAEFDVKGGPTLYSAWLSDLTTLCKSHHYGLSELRRDLFDAKIVGSPPQNLNMRYLAAILRLADVIEFDPERTPEVILRARNISASSRIYWYKDHSISFQLNWNERQIIFSARTPNSTIHKAVLMTEKWVNDELALCSALAQEGSYQKGNISVEAKSLYEWKWPAQLSSDIKPLDYSFEYIDGTFRPDALSILSLLSGPALYGSEIAAIRELLQNSIDAVLEETAYARLQSEDPSDPSLAGALLQASAVTLRIYEEEGRHWIQCTDNGAGMTKVIIEKCLLVGGSSTRGEIHSLERAARSKGFEVGRTGKFGIGVLSYFMIADRLEVVTRRSQRAGGIEGTGWRFVIDGLADFGELRRQNNVVSGSDIRLRMKPGFVGEDVSAWVREIFAYIKGILRWSPCKLTIIDELTDAGVVRLGPGWTADVHEYMPSVLAFASYREDSSIKTESDLSREAQYQDQSSQLADALTTGCRWMAPVMFLLPDNLGIARASLPFFSLKNGNCLGYMALDTETFSKLPGNQDIFLPSSHHTYSWKGFYIRQNSRGLGSTVVDINLVSSMQISVNRESFAQSKVPPAVHVAVNMACEEIADQFLAESKDSEYFLINNVILKYLYNISPSKSLKDKIKRGFKWKVRINGTKQLYWRDLQFPACTLLRTSFMTDVARYPLKAHDSIVHLAEPVEHGDHSPGPNLAHIFGGGRLAYEGSPNRFGGIIGISWNNIDEVEIIDGSIKSLSAEFPIEWRNIIGIYTQPRPIYNRYHRAIDEAGENTSAMYVPDNKIEINNLITDILNSGRTPNGTLLTRFVTGGLRHGPKFWIAIYEQHRDFFSQIVEYFKDIGYDSVVIWNLQSYSNILIELNENGVRYTREGKPTHEKRIVNDPLDSKWKLSTF